MQLDFHELSEQLEQWAGISSCSEIHGLISGLASVGLADAYSHVESAVIKHLGEESCPEQAKTALLSMQKTVLEQLQGSDFDFETLLPSDDEELYVRVEALGQWVQGFLVGFGTGVKSSDLNFSTQSQEVLRDLVEVSKVSKEQLEEDESDEVALTELQEYVRTAVMILYSEFVLSKQAQNVQSPDTYH